MKQLYREEDIKHEAGAFWVLDIGSRGYQVYQAGITHSTKVASIGRGQGLGLERAIKDADRRHAQMLRSEGHCNAGVRRCQEHEPGALEIL